jgi:hypothetical protein
MKLKLIINPLQQRCQHDPKIPFLLPALNNPPRRQKIPLQLLPPNPQILPNNPPNNLLPFLALLNNFIAIGFPY